jgi:hypothetical protein
MLATRARNLEKLLIRTLATCIFSGPLYVQFGGHTKVSG